MDAKKTFCLLGFILTPVFAGQAILSARPIPVQGEQHLKKPPIAHGNPLANPVEAEFVDPISRSAITHYSKLGKIVRGPSPKRIVRNNLNIASTPRDPASVFYLLHLTDLQVVDEESPALTETNDFAMGDTIFQGSYRPQSPYLLHTADAIIQTARKIAEKTRDFDLAVNTGDLAELAQANELNWVLTLMNGGRIDPDSGDKVDLIKGPKNDPNDGFVAKGLGAPWLSVIGNHDMLVQGNFPQEFIEHINHDQIFSSLARSFGQLGITIPNRSIADAKRGGIETYVALNKPLVLSEVPSRTDFFEAFNQYFQNLQAKKITADPNRKTLDRCEFIRAHRASHGTPKGHGFSENNLNEETKCLGNYAYTSKDNPVLRIITLDTNKTHGGAEGAVEFETVDFLKKQLKLAEEYRQLVIVLSHHASDSLLTYNELRMQIEGMLCLQIKGVIPSLDCDARVKDGTLTLENIGEAYAKIPELQQAFDVISRFRKILSDPVEAMEYKSFRKLLASHPNVILHIAGHSHFHKILAICSNGESVSKAGETCEEKGGQAETGYYEIRTSGNADWPQEARILELVDNNDGTLDIYGTVFNALSKSKLAQQGRRLALVDVLTGSHKIQSDSPDDMNVKLTVKIASELDEALDRVKSRSGKIESSLLN